MSFKQTSETVSAKCQ